MGKQLSQQEIKQRLVRLNNLERLYGEQKSANDFLRRENKELREKIVLQQKLIEDLNLQLEELRIKVFGKKKKSDDSDNPKPPEEKIPRTKDSYKRPIPKEITETKRHTIDACSCGTETIHKEVIVFYEEDIPVPVQKIVIRHEVEKAYCPHCKKWLRGMPLPNSGVILGPNIQKYICYLSIICRLSFAQIQSLLKNTYQIKVSQGEIDKILKRESLHLSPFYEKLKEKIRSEPAVHLDETSWRLLTDKSSSYSWVMSGTESKESVFLIGESRGKGNVEKLIGKDYGGIAITDNYVAYRDMPNHQLCWAHLLRNFRDLASSQELDEKQLDYCKTEYQKLCLIYADVKNNRTMERYKGFSKRLLDFSKIKKDEPKKMARFKTTLCKNIDKYLTCLQDPDIPMTNNQAERALRHLVIKRKISFGSLTKKTANNLAILLSVLMSLKQRYPSDFFEEYLKV